MNSTRTQLAILVTAFLVATAAATAATIDFAPPAAWTLSPPLIAPVERPEDPCVSVKDPTVVFADGRWHVFMTIRSQIRTHQTEYLSFEKWEDAAKAPRHLLKVTDKYFCAPQVFYFRPHKKWYLIYQASNPDRKLRLQPAFSTTETVGDPASWTPTKLLFPDADPKGVSRWIDFWVICDDKRAYLFFTSNNGHLWRMSTPIEKFPYGFDDCQLALKADIFEASHTYRLQGQDKFLTVIEAEGRSGRRYYKAYTADRLDGAWQPAADTQDRPFAGAANVRQPSPPWADSISHGELLRAGCDETMTVDPANLKFLIQGVTDKARAGKKYGEIPWRLGLLTPAEAAK